MALHRCVLYQIAARRGIGERARELSMAAEYSVDGLDRWEKAAGLIGGAAGAEQDVANERGYPRHIAVTKSLIFTLGARQFRLYCKYRKSNSRNLDIVSPHSAKISRRRYLHGRTPTYLHAPQRHDANCRKIRCKKKCSAILSITILCKQQKQIQLNCRFFSHLFDKCIGSFDPSDAHIGARKPYRHITELFYYSSLMRHVMREPIPITR